ncbi:MAG: hypothetical protein WC552_07400, partial [Candidatus Omnitrophota bacterium]
EKIAELLLPDNFVCNSTVMARKSCFERVGFFDETIFMPADWEMWMRLAMEYPCGYIDIPLTGYRLSSSYSMGNLEQGEREDSLVLERFLKQRSRLSLFRKNNIIARTYIRFGKRRGATGDMVQARKWFLRAMVKNPLNGKLWLFTPWSFFFPEQAKALLEKKVLWRS